MNPYAPVQRRCACYGIAAVFVVSLAVTSAQGAIVGTRATVTTTVQELIADAPASVNADDAEFPAEGVELPLLASASLSSTDLNGELAAFGQGFSQFLDPARLDQPNPREFALEVGCYSNADVVTYAVEGRAVETRTVRFSQSELDPPAGESSREVTSRTFLSGAVIVWAKEGSPSADGVQGVLRFSVTRDAVTKKLFDTSLTLEGVNASASAEGPLTFERVTLAELADLGIDQPSLSILQRLEDAGRFFLFIIPMQEHEYTYPAVVDESFTLTATLEASIRNAPAGTGIAAVLGRPFEALASIVEPALPGVDAALLERSVNRAVERRSVVSASSHDTSAGGPIIRACGAMGMFFPVGLLLAAVAWRGPVRASRTRRGSLAAPTTVADHHPFRSPG